MARVTVEDCIEKVENRFELIIAASQRAREISNGVQIEVDKDNDKNTVISLREIGDGAITYDDLKERYLKSLQKVVINNDEDEEHGHHSQGLPALHHKVPAVREAPQEHGCPRVPVLPREGG